MAPQIKIHVSNPNSRMEFALDDEIDSLEKVQESVDAGGSVDCEITYSSSTHPFELKSGYPLDLIFLKSLRVIHGILADPTTGDHCGWVQIGRCEVETAAGTEEKVFVEFRFKHAEESKLFTGMPQVDAYLHECEDGEQTGLCQAVKFRSIQHDDLATISWSQSLHLWLVRLKVSMIQNTGNSWLQFFYPPLLYLLQRLTCPPTTGCDHIMAGHPFCNGNYVPDWKCVKLVPPEFQGDEVKIVVRFTSELSNYYGDAFCTALAESAIADFSDTWSNSGISLSIDVNETIIDNTSPGIQLIEQNGATNLGLANKVVSEAIDESDPEGQFHLTFSNYDEGQARGNVIIVGFWAIGLGLVQHEIAHTFGVSHYDNASGNHGSALGPWATIISRQGVEPQRINMFSTRQVKYSAELGTLSCTRDSASLMESNIGFVQYFPQENAR